MCHHFSCLRDAPHAGTRGTTRRALRRAFQWCALEILRTIIDLISVLQSSNLYFFVARTEYSTYSKSRSVLMRRLSLIQNFYNIYNKLHCHQYFSYHSRCLRSTILDSVRTSQKYLAHYTWKSLCKTSTWN